MPAATNRRRLVPALAAAFAVVLMLTGCVGQRDPDKWTDSTKEAFVEACDGTAAKDEPVEEIRTDLEAIAQPTEVCECVIDHLEENMEFSEFKAANSKRRDETDDRSALVGDGFDEAYAACVPGWEPADEGAGSDGADEPVDAEDEGEQVDDAD